MSPFTFQQQVDPALFGFNTQSAVQQLLEGFVYLRHVCKSCGRKLLYNAVAEDAAKRNPVFHQELDDLEFVRISAPLMRLRHGDILWIGHSR